MKKPYLVTESVTEAFPEYEKSAWFKSGYAHDEKSKYFIMLLDDKEWKHVEDYLEDLVKDGGFAWAIEDSNVSLEADSFGDGDELSWSWIKSLGLFAAIEQCLDLTKPQNIAYVIYKFCEREGIEDYFDFARRVAFINGR